MADTTADPSESTYRLEVVVLPVADVDRAKAFYSDGMGFDVDVDHSAGEDFRVVQLTPPGSACSVTLMSQPDRAGAVQGLHLVVRDIEVAPRRTGVPRGRLLGLLPLHRSWADTRAASRPGRLRDLRVDPGP